MVCTACYREVRYGISLGIRNVTVDPLQPAGAQFVFAIGNVMVDYRGHSETTAGAAAVPSGVRMRLPGAGPREYMVTGMAPLQGYAISWQGAACGANVTTVTVDADAKGVLRFAGAGAEGCEVSATVAKSLVRARQVPE